MMERVVAIIEEITGGTVAFGHGLGEALGNPGVCTAYVADAETGKPMPAPRNGHDLRSMFAPNEDYAVFSLLCHLRNMHLAWLPLEKRVALSDRYIKLLSGREDA